MATATISTSPTGAMLRLSADDCRQLAGQFMRRGATLGTTSLGLLLQSVAFELNNAARELDRRRPTEARRAFDAAYKRLVEGIR